VNEANEDRECAAHSDPVRVPMRRTPRQWFEAHFSLGDARLSEFPRSGPDSSRCEG